MAEMVATISERGLSRSYWLATRAQMLVCLAVTVSAVPFLPRILRALDGASFMGFPLGYFLAFHGLFGLSFLSLIWLIRRQGEIDRRHGANEDI
jgi:putative solute:sodium symporter small subunit